MPSILFICVHNACRSQIAEAIFRNLASCSWVIASAGTDPSDQIDPKAAAILDRYHLVASSPKPNGLNDLPATKWDYVVRMDGGEKRIPLQAGQTISWDVPDPFDGPMELYETLYKNLEQRILELIRKIRTERPK